MGDESAVPAGTPELDRWRRTSPFAIVFFIRQTLAQIDAIGQVLMAVGLTFLIVRAREYAGELIPAAILLIIMVAVLRYWFYRFRTEEDRILIRQGILKKTALDLPLDRIQAVNVQRSLTDRLLGLVTVSLDTAGSGAVEAVIPSVRSAIADRVRARVATARRDRHRSEGEADGSAIRPASQRADVGPGREPRDAGLATRIARDAGSPGDVVMKLPPGDMVRIGMRVLGDSTVAFLPIMFFVRPPGDMMRFIAGHVGILEPISRDQLTTPYVMTVADALVSTGFATALLAGIAALGIYYAFTTHYGFTLYRHGAAHRTLGGLFTQREVVVQSVKVQQVRLSQNLVDRCFRRFRLRAEPVSDDAEVLEVPLLGARTAEALRAELFGPEGRGLTLLPDNPAIVRVSPTSSLRQP